MDELFFIRVSAHIFMRCLIFCLFAAQMLQVALVAMEHGNKIWSRRLIQEIAFLYAVFTLAAITTMGKMGGEYLFPFGYVFLDVKVLMWLNVIPLLLCFYMLVKQKQPAIILDLCIIFIATPIGLSVMNGMWAEAFIISLALLIFRMVIVLGEQIKLTKNTVSKVSPFEAINLLPEGVLCATNDGRIIMLNDAMRSSLARLMIPTDYVDTPHLWDRLRAKSPSSSEANCMSLRIPLSQTETKLFCRKEFLMKNRLCTQIVAYEVSEEELLNKQLEEANSALLETGFQLRQALNNVRLVEQNDAILRLKSRIHDIVGQRLSILHRYLESETISLRNIIEVSEMFTTLKEDLITGTKYQNLANLDELIKSLKLIDVSLELTGELPQDPEVASVLICVLREASTNAVRHAHASLVKAEFVYQNDCTALIVRNNGKAFSGTYTEGVGIPGMRYALEQLGGSLHIELLPEFTLKAAVPLRVMRECEFVD